MRFSLNERNCEMYKAWIILLTVFIIVSCSSVKDGAIFQHFEEDDIHSGSIEDRFLYVEIAYIGAIGHSYIFECTIENKSSGTVIIDKSAFAMEFNQDLVLNSIDEEVVVYSLQDQETSLRKEKKNSTLLNGIFIGIGVIAGAASGLNAAEVIGYSADPLLAIFDERRWYQRNIETVEDEIEYVRSAQFHDFHLDSGSSVTRDVLFPTVRVTTDVEVVFIYRDEEYAFTFPKKIFR